MGQAARFTFRGKLLAVMLMMCLSGGEASYGCGQAQFRADESTRRIFYMSDSVPDDADGPFTYKLMMMVGDDASPTIQQIDTRSLSLSLSL